MPRNKKQGYRKRAELIRVWFLAILSTHITFSYIRLQVTCHLAKYISLLTTIPLQHTACNKWKLIFMVEKTRIIRNSMRCISIIIIDLDFGRVINFPHLRWTNNSSIVFLIQAWVSTYSRREIGDDAGKLLGPCDL